MLRIPSMCMAGVGIVVCYGKGESRLGQKWLRQFYKINRLLTLNRGLNTT